MSETSSSSENKTEALSGAADPARFRRLAAVSDGFSEDDSSDRLLITLLSLNLILLAFFVVLNVSSSFDTERVRAVAESARTNLLFNFNQRQEERTQRYQGLLSGFRNAVADQFAAVVPSANGTASQPDVRLGTGRVEVDVPATVFFRPDGTLYDRLPTLDGLAAVIGTPPDGYRAELAIRAVSPAAAKNEMVERLAILADDLVARGVSPAALSTGIVSPAASSQTAEMLVPMLRFTFFLLEDSETGTHAPRLMLPQSPSQGTGS